jgi:hypothetical protein
MTWSSITWPLLADFTFSSGASPLGHSDFQNKSHTKKQKKITKATRQNLKKVFFFP